MLHDKHVLFKHMYKNAKSVKSSHVQGHATKFITPTINLLDSIQLPSFISKWRERPDFCSYFYEFHINWSDFRYERISLFEALISKARQSYANYQKSTTSLYECDHQSWVIKSWNRELVHLRITWFIEAILDSFESRHPIQARQRTTRSKAQQSSSGPEGLAAGGAITQRN